MNTPKRIAKNTFVQFTALILSWIPNFFAMLYTARYLGAGDFGVLSFALAFTGMFGGFSDMGLGQLIVREVARDLSLTSKYLSNIIVIKIILAFILYGLISLAINLFGYPLQTVMAVYLVALQILLNIFSSTFCPIFQAHERMEYQSFGQVLNGALMFVGVILVMKYNLGVIGIACLYPFCAMVITLYSFYILKKKILQPSATWSLREMEIDWTFWKQTIRKSLPFGLAVLFVMIWYQLHIIMLSAIKGDTIVGWFNAAYKIESVMLFIPQAFIAAIYPVMAKFHESDQHFLIFSFDKSLKYLTIIAIPIGVGTTILAERFILMIFGIEYLNSVVALQILVWASVFVFMSIPFANLLNCLNRQSIVLKITGICLVSNVILNLILIPRYGLIGASISFVLTEFVSLCLSFFCIFRVGCFIPNYSFLNIIIKVLIASILMGVFVESFLYLNLLLIIPSAAVLYFIFLFVSNGIDKEDLSLLRRVLR